MAELTDPRVASFCRALVRVSGGAPHIPARELEVLYRWIARAEAPADIAESMVISQKTVEVHLTNARHRLGWVNQRRAWRVEVAIEFGRELERNEHAEAA